MRMNWKFAIKYNVIIVIDTNNNEFMFFIRINYFKNTVTRKTNIKINKSQNVIYYTFE